MRDYLFRSRFDVLRGTLDVENPLSALRGNAFVWREIFDDVEADWYERHLDRASQAFYIPGPEASRYHVKFPKPKDININMMPFRLFSYPLEIPNECKGYADFIYRCRRHVVWEGDDVSFTNENRIAYLTIQESAVPVGQAQRRPGLHVERPGAVVHGGHIVDAQHPDYRQLMWGLGWFPDEGIPTDGIFTASSVPDSCKVWPLLVSSPEEVSDRHGGIEPMRKHLGPGVSLPANTLCWITDRTPHESLPLKAPADNPTAQTVYRQFFRLVVGPISVWYSRHNTPNPLGVQPDAPISDEDKFTEPA